MRDSRFYAILYVICNLLNETLEKSIQRTQTVIVVSYDAFRNEYFERNVTPYMLQLREEGVYADYLMNVFPTKTFTNHYSIVTGLYPGIHGVTANTVYDTKLGNLHYGYELFHYDPEILPIWSLNEKSGGTSGCMMWPGSDFEYSNISCTYVQKYDSKIPLEERIDTVISWLKNSRDPPNLVMIYIEMPDKLAHAKGPDSPEITKIINKLDNITRYLHDQLKSNKLTDYTNVIHLSDHGMIGVTSPYFINLTNYLEPNSCKMYGTSPVLQIIPSEGKEEDVYNRLKKAALENSNFNIYTYDTLPERWHATNKRRFGPIIAVANLGYAFQDMWEAAEYYLKNYNVPISETSSYGIHGYDNIYPEMHPFFIAIGPLFKERHKIKPFSTLDIFNLLCDILKIKDLPPTNGTLSNVIDSLKGRTSKGLGVGSISVIVAACIIFLVLIIYGIVYFKRRRSYFFGI